ncbi:hypothetical protein SAMN05421874_11338 [Nonomuraea maritima]|uniref:Uncharacterized protein n=1 Tax=Nonomuraea maritima TaxID=683260 RepID=A0A1G9FW22_9ACTN|nr:hypothetical protein SAMN05421874_11338 [Nonomuraea maritima]
MFAGCGSCNCSDPLSTAKPPWWQSYLTSQNVR